jgi:hypothetical protein
MQEFAAAHPELRVTVLDNPGKILSSGWNAALSCAQGDIILRVDAHSRIPSDFIKKNAVNILSGQDIVGGVRISQTSEASASEASTLEASISEASGGLWEMLLLAAEKSKFGSGAADFRNPGSPGYVDTLAHAAYRREVFEAVGGYDERLVRNQDMEIHRRMKMAGYRLFFNPQIISYHIVRSSLKGILCQKWHDGKWIGLALGISPRCFSLRHFIPAMFSGALIISLTMGIWGILGVLFPFLLLSSVYGLAALAFTIEAIVKAPLKVKPLCVLLPGIFLLIHLSYGLGTWFGLARMPIFIRKRGNYQVPWPIKGNRS